MEAHQDEMKGFATKRDVMKIYSDMKAYTSQDDLNKFKNEITPIANEAVAMLQSNKTESQMVREIIRRFDEVISDKASKHSISELRKELEANFARVTRLQELNDRFDTLALKNERVLAKVYEKLDSTSGHMEETVKGITDAQIQKRMKDYERVTQSFSKFFNSDELQLQLDRKIDREKLQNLFKLKASKKEFDQTVVIVENIY